MTLPGFRHKRLHPEGSVTLFRVSVAAAVSVAGMFLAPASTAASPEVLHIPVTQTSCFPKHICFYREINFLGGGIAVRAGFDLNNLGGSLGIDDQMSSWRNMSTERYCWYPDPNFAGIARVMRPESDVSAVAADENDLASSVSSC
ncbi:peptidase inhibitor family I36 protein [Streptomyces sp. NPDC008121]|uniref:peptidase inhibitor family I36 protein n=1 Tax=Streptomyces sp. NPDC008121 TaxID=3364809 RepID=UPI0036E53B64